MEVDFGIGVGAGPGTEVGISCCGRFASNVLASDPRACLPPDSTKSRVVLRVVGVWRFCNNSVGGRSRKSVRSGTFSSGIGLPRNPEETVPVVEKNPHSCQDGFHPGGIIHTDVDQLEGGDASDFSYCLVVDPGLDHQIPRIPDMFLKEANQSVGPLSLRLFELKLPFYLPELGLQLLFFPDQLGDPGILFRHVLFPGHLGECNVYVLYGDIT